MYRDRFVEFTALSLLAIAAAIFAYAMMLF
jgi:hypothetical protein